MRSPVLYLFVPCLFAASAFSQSNRAPGPAETAPKNAASEGASAANYIVGDPIRHKNLTIFPVFSRTEQNADRYITLDEGLRSHTVEVIEVGANENGNGPAVPVNPAPGNASPQQALSQIIQNAANSAGNEVNRLMVINRSDKPLYLMPGEVIVGGSQDRTIGVETAVAPTGKPVPIDVFCVEHGRWSQRDFEDSGVVLEAIGAPADQVKALAGESQKGKFVATPGPLSKAGRVAVQSGKGQGEVWENVAKTNAALKVDSQSGAFTQAYADKSVRDELGPYVAELSAKVSSTARVVGAVVAINGKIESVDVFESTPLFRKLWPKLLKSYALDAVGAANVKPAIKGKHGTRPQPNAKESTVADASAFLEKVLQGTVKDSKRTPGGLVVTRRETKDATSYSAGARGMGGGFGGAPVHASGFSR